MSVNGVGSSSALLVQSLVGMRSQLDDLQRQLGTGKKSDSYAGVGLDRGLAVGMRTQLSAVSSWQSTITSVGVPIQVQQTALDGMTSINQAVKSAVMFGTYDPNNTNQTTGQRNARGELGEVFDLLNSQAGDRYLFSGRALDTPATDTISRVLDGDATHAGFTQVMNERNQADLGANGLGRLVIPTPPAAPAPLSTVVSMSEDVAGSPFGLKLAAVNSSLTNAAVTGPAGSPAAISVDFVGGNPNPGDTIKFSLNLPDGSTEDLTLTATTSATPGPNEFTIGTTPDVTATNMQAALTGSIGTLARTSLTAASAIAAGNDFFNIDAANPPQRVAGPPFDSATALTAGTPANTVMWYTGEAGSDPARTTSTARIDQTLTVSYGVRANEEALRNTVKNIAVFATMKFSPTDPDAPARYQALQNRLGSSMQNAAGQQKISDISGDLATAQATLQQTKSRHDDTNLVLSNMLDSIEGISQEQVAAEILTMNTRLQASLQTTARLFQTNLVNYL
jgi:flagellar hook-associated protein 3 FlgL